MTDRRSDDERLAAAERLLQLKRAVASDLPPERLIAAAALEILERLDAIIERLDARGADR